MFQIIIAASLIVIGIVAIRAIRARISERPTEIQRQKEIARVRQNKVWEDLSLTGSYDVKQLRHRRDERGTNYFEHNAR